MVQKMMGATVGCSIDVMLDWINIKNVSNDYFLTIPTYKKPQKKNYLKAHY